ncbi:hypothetical protein [Paenibacillus herberti]|uniref:Uncharacterized protein n=1 Tax=Paenibacillus herberti TaxID=1619309 RepID=A0A229NUP3_9BACL|nr:hypothetical protein [Paenibacillus herberti]OXM13611.1 hypothetical protein CGZ75_21545 [Paenibacillus herberti]
MKYWIRWHKTGLAAVLLLAIVAVHAATGPLPKASAGVWNNLKDIYETPAKVDELEKQYTESLSRLEEQQKLLQEEYTRKQAELEARQQELTGQNDDFRRQNEQLVEDNKALEAQMQQAEERQAKIKRSIAWTVLIISVTFLAYIAALRIWRYRVYRSQQRGGRGTAL